MAAFPDAKVILTVRDSQRWYESIMQTIYAVSRAPLEEDTPERRAHRAMVFEVIWDGLFDDRMDDHEHVIAVYEAHNQRVRDTVPAGRLLTLKAITTTGDQVSSVRVLVDGVAIAYLDSFGVAFGGDDYGVAEIPFGVTIGSGEEVLLEPAFGPAVDQTVVLGYLSEAGGGGVARSFAEPPRATR